MCALHKLLHCRPWVFPTLSPCNVYEFSIFSPGSVCAFPTLCLSVCVCVHYPQWPNYVCNSLQSPCHVWVHYPHSLPTMCRCIIYKAMLLCMCAFTIISTCLGYCPHSLHAVCVCVHSHTHLAMCVHSPHSSSVVCVHSRLTLLYVCSFYTLALCHPAIWVYVLPTFSPCCVIVIPTLAPSHLCVFSLHSCPAECRCFPHTHPALHVHNPHSHSAVCVNS